MSYVYVFPLTQAAVPIAACVSLFPVHRIYCVGRNYAEHAKEMGFEKREQPFFFCKPADAVVPIAGVEQGRVAYPPKTDHLHHEIELVVAIGEGGRDIAVRDAGRHIFGYAVGVDMTRRDLQLALRDRGRPWELGKAFDQSAPISAIHQAGSSGVMEHGEIWLKVNGAERQRADLSELVWSVPEIIGNLSSYFMLLPGDLIFTGTPAGVGKLVRGDIVEAGIAGLSELRFTIV
jgi:fumarylpyruvate hydrolase